LQNQVTKLAFLGMQRMVFLSDLGGVSTIQAKKNKNEILSNQ